ncbi:hypothetical protein [Streptomyces sp. SPB162]|uniref:hypothetical protein n=1 Tax=Streptomyces sp. SPB162 TaxID=2940560 RepID=UPI00240511E0|nr:hypothetical protein [Streptomyces sp. SPB162]MDF9810942.1 hypothetical protein [Streptomyces sp. SPB162]
MPSDQEIRDRLRTWVLGKASGLSAADLTDRTPLFEERHLRSVHLPELLLFLERLRASPIDVEDLRPGDFRDIHTIVDRFGGAAVTP